MPKVRQQLRTRDIGTVRRALPAPEPATLTKPTPKRVKGAPKNAKALAGASSS